MISKFLPARSVALVVAALVSVASIEAVAGDKVTQRYRDVTLDGLHRIDDSVMEATWIRPNFDLKRYTKLQIVPVDMTFKAVERNTKDKFPMNDEQKERVRQAVLDAFTTELGKLKGFTITDRPGPDVLQVQGAILDVVSHVPTSSLSNSGYIVRSLGEASFVLELRDSVSEEVLVRAVDHREIAPSQPHISSRVNNEAQVRAAAQDLAMRLRKRLDLYKSV